MTSYLPPRWSLGYWLSRLFNGAMHVRNFLHAPPFIMYYLTFLLPEVETLLRQEGLAVEVRDLGFEGPAADFRLVLATRTDPPLPLGRLRAGGDLSELRADELRFSEEETTAFLTEGLGLDLATEDVARLQVRTEGWPAAVYLAALSLRGRADTSALIARFAGDDRYVVDYLTAEVLARQPPELRSFLLRTSILRRWRRCTRAAPWACG